jgi:ABC transporter ATM
MLSPYRNITCYVTHRWNAGALNRVIDRGTRGINWTLSSMVFNVVPTVFEVAMVSAILTAKCGASLAALTCGTVGTYMAFTFSVTQV